MSLLSVDEAQQLVLQHTPVPTAFIEIPLHAALGKVLAEEISSDGDSPPFDKSMVDGYAIRSSDIQAGITSSGIKLKSVWHEHRIAIIQDQS